MRKIKPEDIKIGDWLILDKKKNYTYIFKITGKNSYDDKVIFWWLLRGNNLDSEFSDSKGKTTFTDENFNRFIVYRLNKRETLKIKKQIMLKRLE